MSSEAKSIRLESREYKIMLDHLRFSDADETVASFWSELQRAAEQRQPTCTGNSPG